MSYLRAGQFQWKRMIAPPRPHSNGSHARTRRARVWAAGSGFGSGFVLTPAGMMIGFCCVDDLGVRPTSALAARTELAGAPL